MIIERDFRTRTYIVRIPREEIIDIFVYANSMKGDLTTDEIASKIMANKILKLISDVEGGSK